MNILFRVNAGSSVGVGHLMRCLALAQCLDTDNIHSHFIVNAEAVDLCEKRQDWVGQLCPILKFSVPTDEPKWLESYCTKHKIDAIVIDGYDFSNLYRKSLKLIGIPIICFDDMNNSGNLWADLVINGAQNAHTLNYQQSAPGAVLCLGEKYRVMRKEFNNKKNLPFAERTDLLITMGGSDPAQLTLPLLKALDSKSFSGTISLVTGSAFCNVEAIEEFLINSSLKLTHHHDCQTMASLMRRSRLAVSAAGGSQFELLNCASPSVLVVVADNQVNATQGAMLQGWCEMQDIRLEQKSSSKQMLEQAIKIDELAELAIDLWNNTEKLTTMHSLALDNADSFGAQRVVNKIMDLIT